MTKIKGYVVIAFLTMCMVFVLSMFVITDQYDEELNNLRIELKQKKKDNQMMALAIESLLDQVNGKKAIECEHGVYEYEKGYIIDGYYYELKEQVGE